MPVAVAVDRLRISDVDLVEKAAIRNPFRRKHILSHHEVIYAAQ